jgi:aspartokinase
VLSAVYGVTNRLLQCVKHAEAGDRQSLSRERDALLDGHVALLRALCPPHARAQHEAYLHGSLTAAIDVTCADVLGAGVASAHQRDLTSSAGERWSTRLMWAHLTDGLGREAHAHDAVDVIVTDGVAGDARPLLAETRARVAAALAPRLAGGAIGLLTGFYGADAGGRLTTLGRGGSDLSAAVLGFCLDAAEIQLYKVEHTGVGAGGWMQGWAPGWVGIAHCAEPAITIPAMHYEEARELAHFAKKVLHPDTVSPAVEKGIPLAVLNSLQPELAGTLIVGGSAAALGAPRALTCTRVPLRSYETLHAPLVDLPLAWLDCDRDSAFLVALVGLNVMHVPGLAARAGEVLRAAGIRHFVPRRVNGSAHNFTVVVPRRDKEAVMRLFHTELVLRRAG